MTTVYRLSISDVAEREMRRLPGTVKQRIRRMVNSLASNPYPPETKELRGRPGRYRIRLDKWRIIYRVDDDAVLVEIMRVRRKTGSETPMTAGDA